MVARASRVSVMKVSCRVTDRTQRSVLSVSGLTLIDVQAGRRPHAHLVWWRGRELPGYPLNGWPAIPTVCAHEVTAESCRRPWPCQPPGRTDFRNVAERPLGKFGGREPWRTGRDPDDWQRRRPPLIGSDPAAVVEAVLEMCWGW